MGVSSALDAGVRAQVGCAGQIGWAAASAQSQRQLVNVGKTSDLRRPRRYEGFPARVRDAGAEASPDADSE
jgi:hypothetical protein